MAGCQRGKGFVPSFLRLCTSPRPAGRGILHNQRLMNAADQAKTPTQGQIQIRGARQHNLKNLNLDIATGQITVVTGPSGSGKSSLVFDTLFAEGQRRYVETFSAYARQFLDRMDKPAVDRLDGVPPAIAIDQSNPVRSSRSTVGTMTELNDHFKLLFARAAALFDQETGLRVAKDSLESIQADLAAKLAGQTPRVQISFALPIPDKTTAAQMQEWLQAGGFSKVLGERDTRAGKVLDVVADRFRWGSAEPQRVLEALETALRHGAGQLRVLVEQEAVIFEPTSVIPAQEDSQPSSKPVIPAQAGIHDLNVRNPHPTLSLGERGQYLDSRLRGNDEIPKGLRGNDEPPIYAYSTGLHCPPSDISYQEPSPALFSFNSAHGACPTCRGFGRVIGVDMGLVIPDAKLTLRQGAIKPMQTPAWKEAQDDLMRHAEVEGIPRDTPFKLLTPEQQHWVINGSPLWKGQWNKQWFGVRRFFEYLESKAYKMHIRVLLSKYRSYTPCPDCAGARLKTESLLWRVGSKALADSVLPPEKRFLPQGVSYGREVLEKLDGLCLHDVMQLPIGQLQAWMQGFAGELNTIKKEAAQAGFTALNADLMPKIPHGNADAKALSILLEEIQTRLKYLVDVGLAYLSLDRQSRTLSGGEVQRINLTTALGTSLVNTLFVLDEPSIGLHPRDMQRINQAMLRLRDAGNTLVVVEHDPAVMQVADRIIDMGPGPGAAGGQIVFDGKPAALAQADTLTGAYLGGRKTLGLGLQQAIKPNQAKLLLRGARANNLKNIEVEIPLGALVCITGVSGSGKSTLVQDVLAPALLRHFGKQTESPGEFDELLGAEQLADVVFVDQSPIGKTARSNPASYVGAWDAIRDIFATAPLAKERSYSRAHFSFNAGDGRCPTCGGSGFEHIEMQFLSDVYLRCEDCQGARYRPEILQVQIERQDRSLNVADCLALTVAEALTVFAADRAVQIALQPLLDVGLGYVQLGQPVPTLSGGEAQRLKIAGHLAENAKTASASRQKLARKGTLFLLDEPTTGLHFDDIAKLMRALRKLQDAGHSLLLIEHNLDVIRASDWLIDLGPEAGDGGGRIVAQGSPADVQAKAQTHTAQALRDYAHSLQNWGVAEKSSPYSVIPAKAGIHGAESIQVINATEHNLQHLSVNIPRGQMNVITGVSGSGKSTLAFDIVFSEGQRRYLESLNAYARSIVQPPARPEVDAVYGIPPTVAIEQRLSRGGRKSTVGTATEVWHFLRLLFVKLGVQHCVHDGAAVQPQSREQISADILRLYTGQHIGLLAPLVSGRKGLYTELASWAKKLGHTHLRVDGAFLPTQNFPRIDRFTEHQIELPIADIEVCPENEAFLRLMVDKALQLGKGVVQVLAPLHGLAEVFATATLPEQQQGLGQGIGQVHSYSTERACPLCHTSYAAPDPRLFSYNSKHGWCPDCVGTGLAMTREQRRQLDGSAVDAKDKGREQSFVETEVEGLGDAPCRTCAGTRLNAVARGVLWHPSPAGGGQGWGLFRSLLKPSLSPDASPHPNLPPAGEGVGTLVQGVSITQLAQLSVAELHQFFSQLRLTGRAADIARDLLPEITSRLAFMLEVGLGYLTLDRGAPTISGGEAQRIRLAAQLGSNLQGVCYVLDEPTIGLHPRDNRILLGALRKLADQGNTLMVVEHDEDTIRQADHIIDIGPGAGSRGGQLVAQGSVATIAANPASTTGRYLGDARRYQFNSCSGRFDGSESLKHLKIEAAKLHNLQGLDVSLPLAQLVVITGVSGSGKSTLARDVLLANVQAAIASKGAEVWQHCTAIEGWQELDRVLEVDQTPIGKTPRSCPATYIGFWDAIRKLFAETSEAKARGYSASRFSFNTGAGRCPACEGQGMRTVAMSFLPDVKVPCEVCNGARFNPQTLGVHWRGKSVGDVLQMEVDEALEFFAHMPAMAHPLQLLHDVGLGYLQLGQASPTLSGGEAQRLKLVTELTKVRDEVGRRGQKAPRTLYVLDEPTVGLHMADVQRIIAVLQRLVAAGHSVLVVEHDLDLMTKADWLIDMGPEGGAGGGQVVAQGRPQDLAAQAASHTGRALQNHGKMAVR